MKGLFALSFGLAMAAFLAACIFDNGDSVSGGRRSGSEGSADAGVPAESGVTVNIVINLGDGG